METRNETSMIYYLSFTTALLEMGMPDKDRLAFYDGLLQYGTLGILPSFTNPILKGLFRICKENIDADVRRRKKRTKQATTNIGTEDLTSQDKEENRENA